MGIFSHIPRPFQKETVDLYPGVLVPLAQAKRHETVEAEYARRYSLEGRPASAASKKEDGGDVDGGAPETKESKETKLADEEGSPTRSRAWDGVYTVDMLRDEINADVAASGHDGAYDGMYSPPGGPSTCVAGRRWVT